MSFFVSMKSISKIDYHTIQRIYDGTQSAICRHCKEEGYISPDVRIFDLRLYMQCARDSHSNVVQLGADLLYEEYGSSQ